jgi:hypothetical protein
MAVLLRDPAQDDDPQPAATLAREIATGAQTDVRILTSSVRRTIRFANPGPKHKRNLPVAPWTRRESAPTAKAGFCSLGRTLRFS